MASVASAADSAEDVLARLERYAAFVRAHHEPPLHREVMRRVIHGTVWVWPILAATAVVMAFAQLASALAWIVAGALGAVGGVAMACRVRYSSAWTLGVAVGVLLAAVA